METPNAGRAPRRALRLALAAAAALLGPAVAGTMPRAHAHDHPLTLSVQVFESITFSVTDAADCSAFMTAEVEDTSLATITPSSGEGISVDFTVTAKGKAGTTNIIVSWVGEDVGGMGPCQEVSGPRAIALTVTAFPEENSTASRPTSGHTGDPVDTFNGELYFLEDPDLDLGGDLPLRFQRWYASRLRLWFIVGDMGDNWRHGFEWRIHTNGTVLHLVDGRGKVAKYLKMGPDWVLQNRVDTPYTVTQAPGEFRVSDPSTNLQYRFDAGGTLMQVRDGKGRAHDLTYDLVTGKLDRVEENLAPATRRGLRFTYLHGRVASVQEYQGSTPGRIVLFTQDHATENLLAAQNPEGGFTTYEYDAAHNDAGLLLRRTRPAGNVPWAQTYDAVGKVATQTDAYGNEWKFDYGNPYKPGITKVTRPDGTFFVHKHDANGALIAAINPAKKTVLLGDDDSKHRSSVETVRGGGFTAAFGAASGRIESSTDSLGRTTQWTHGTRADGATGLPLHDLARVDWADGTFETFSRDSMGNLLERIDEAGNSWTWTRDARGRPLTETNPRGGVTTSTWDAAGNLATETDDAGNTTTFGYDAHNRKVLETYDDGKSRSWTWDDMDRMLTSTDEEGAVRTHAWDSNGNLVLVTPKSGNTVSYQYDLMDRLVLVMDGGWNSSTVTWDSLGRFERKTDRRGAEVTNTWDPRDLLASCVDQLGLTWSTLYDDDGNVAAVVDPQGRRFAFTRDTEGILRAATTPALRTTRFVHDERSRLVLEVDGEDRPIERGYDPRGLLIRRDAGGGLAASDLLNDDNGLFEGIIDGNGNDWSWGRDDQGRHSSRADPLGRTTTLSWDNRNRVASHALPGMMGTLTLTHDGAGRVTKREYSDATVLDTAWTGDGLPSSGTGFDFQYDSYRRMSGSNGLGIGRDADGRVTSVTYAPGKVVNYEYNSRGELVGVSDWAGGGMTFTRDTSGRVVFAIRDNGVETEFGYDNDGLITSIRHGALGTVLLTRDGSGAVVSADRTLPSESPLEGEREGTWAYDAAAQLVGPAHDELGRMTQDALRDFTWDLASRLTGTEVDTETTLHAYDAFGSMTSRSDGTFTDDYAWNYAMRRPVLTVARRSGSPLRYFVWTPDGTLLYRIEEAGQAHRYYHFDEAGNTLFLTLEDGSVGASYAYTAYGVMTVATGIQEDAPFLWKGEWGAQYEPRTGTCRMGSRVYDPSTRRFLTRDDRAGLADPVPGNPYAYASGNPLRWADPTGEAPQPAQTEGGVVDWTNFGANYVGTTAEAVEASVKLNGNQYTASGRSTSAAASKVGTAATVLGAGIEVYKGSERQDAAGDRFLNESKAAWDEYKRLLAEAWNLYTVKKRITYDQYKEFRRALMELREARLERNRDNFTVDTLANATITTLNLLTNLIPGGGIIIDWGDHIQH